MLEAVPIGPNKCATACRGGGFKWKGEGVTEDFEVFDLHGELEHDEVKQVLETLQAELVKRARANKAIPGHDPKSWARRPGGSRDGAGRGGAWQTARPHAGVGEPGVGAGAWLTSQESRPRRSVALHRRAWRCIRGLEGSAASRAAPLVGRAPSRPGKHTPWAATTRGDADDRGGASQTPRSQAGAWERGDRAGAREQENRAGAWERAVGAGAWEAGERFAAAQAEVQIAHFATLAISL